MRPPVQLDVLTRSRAGASHALHGQASQPHPRPTNREDRRLIDSHGRIIRDLRLSITDRCNFRCVYCMDPDVRFLDSDRLLTVDELGRAARLCVNLGIDRIRLTGGEPTLHPRLDDIIAGIAALGVRDLSMTTNGALVDADRCASWKSLGLRRLTFSLDSVEEAAFSRMTRSTSAAARVVDAIRAAKAAGLGPIKVNAVVVRGMNEDQVPLLADLARDVGFEMRFIEYMPLDSGRKWSTDLLVPAHEIVELIRAVHPILPRGKAEASSTSETWAFTDDPDTRHAGIGIIAPVTRAFCGACSRLRITADGQVRPCLFSLQEFDLRSIMRSGGNDAALEEFLLDSIWTKQAGHGITAPEFARPDRTMSAIGG